MELEKKETLMEALTKLGQAYQVMDNGVLHTNNTTMLLYVKEFKAIQSCILKSMACIKDAIDFGKQISADADKFSVYAEVENSPLAEAAFALTEDEVKDWLVDRFVMYQNALPADSSTNLKLEVCKLAKS